MKIAAAAALATAALLLAPAANQPAGTVQVFLLVGQSNMQGKGKVDHLRELASADSTREVYGHWLDAEGAWIERDDVSIWTLDRSGPLTVGYGAPADRFGPELEIGHVLGERFEEPVLLVKLAWGGKSLAVDFRPPSAGGELGPFYTQTLELYRERIAKLAEEFPALAGREPELAGLFWFQGWNDRINQAHNDEYEQNLVHLIGDLRRDLGAPRLPVVVGETGQGGVAETHPRALSLMAAQKAACDREELGGRVRFVPTREYYDDEPRHDGGYHFFGNAANFFRIGAAFGKGMLALLDEGD